MGDLNPMKRKEISNKVSLKLMGNKNHYGKPHLEETKKIISEKNKGKHFSVNTEFKKGCVSFMKGKHHSEESKNRISNKSKGKHYSIETEFKKGSSGFVGKHTEESKRKMSDSLKGRTVWNKGLTKNDERVERYSKEISKVRIKYFEDNPKEKIRMKKMRAKQVFPVKDTLIELKIQDFLTLLKIEFLTHKYMNIKNGYQCDILIPKQKGISQKTIIECDGDFFHMNPNKFKANDKCFKNGMTAKEKWKLDDDRTNELIEKGFRVIRLWENEIRQMEVNNFKGRIK